MRDSGWNPWVSKQDAHLEILRRAPPLARLRQPQDDNLRLIRRKHLRPPFVLPATQQPITRNGKPPATEGRKATGLMQAAELPNVIPHDAGRFS